MPDLTKTTLQLQAMEAFFYSYRAFTAKPDEMLARRGLSRVHHRILFFIARNPGLSVSQLLAALGVTKQALNVPLRQLLERDLIRSEACDNDKRRRLLELTAEGGKLEKALRQEQGRLLQRAFDEAGEDAVRGWLAVNQAIAHSQDEG
ncbi:MarR family winged helix-turn-helix transcriptional regulator [Pseudomonas sp. NY15437]|uniref:MarR family winged helix-turn-helix transcriptional regulator n=1 Tax=Pseudomonas sp. NY15437 TaxID=3400360 RepID=UPI003A8C1482